MNLRGVFVFAALLFGAFASHAQTTNESSYSEYQFFFSGTAYETNASGKMVGTPINDQTLLQDRARLGHIAASSVAIVYHLNGNAMGDTIDIVAVTNGQVLTTELELFFGSDGSLGRTAVTNQAGADIRRVDYIYTDNNSTYTFDNDDSVGEAMTQKLLTVVAGVTNDADITGSMSWGVAPQGTNGPILIIGQYSTGQPLF